MSESSLPEAVLGPAAALPEIPGYRLLEKIGDGGMGAVFRAQDVDRNRQVAVKFFHSGPKELQSDLRHGRGREPRLLASLAHPHVVAVYDWGQVAGRDYLVMEFVPGTTLRALMSPGRPLPPGQAAPVLDSVARALSYVHSRGILHLDLKPENVLCASGGQIKITDFGLALAQVEAHTLVDLGLALGTIDYCSPEQRHGLPVDARSDLFSLAVMAYEVLTGRLPGRVYVPCGQRGVPLPPGVDAALCRGLARNPEQRYARVQDFGRDLAEALRPTTHSLAGLNSHPFFSGLALASRIRLK